MIIFLDLHSDTGVVVDVVTDNPTMYLIVMSLGFLRDCDRLFCVDSVGLNGLGGSMFIIIIDCCVTHVFRIQVVDISGYTLLQ